MNSLVSASRIRVLAVAGVMALTAMSYLAQFLAERLGHADHPGLGGGIGGQVRVAFLAGDRRDVDDAAVIAGLHRGDHHLVDVEGAVEIDLDDPAPFVGIIVLEGGIGAGDAGRVDQDVDTGRRSFRSPRRRRRPRHNWRR